MAHQKWTLFEGHSALEAAAFILLLLFVATAAIPYGAVTPGGALYIEIGGFVIGALAVLTARGRIGAAAIPIAFLLGIALIGAFQMLPLPDSLIAALSPTSHAIYADAASTLRLFGDTAPLTERVSIAPAETVRASLLIVAYAALFAASALLLRTRLQRRALIIVLLATSVIHVVYAAATQSADNPDDAYATRLHGAFVNANHFAGYLEIMLMLAFAVVWTEVLTGRSRTSPLDEKSQIVEKRFVRISWRVLIWAIIGIGIALTRSRMGIAASVVTTLLLVAFSLLHRGSGKRRAQYAITAAGVLIAGFVMVAITTREIPFVRFLASDPRDPESDVRYRLWALSLKAWQHFPILGSGLGTYRDAFRRVQPNNFPGLFEQAHSDSLQLLVTGGWISVVLALAAFVALFAILSRAWWNQQHREESAIAIASMAAAFSLLLHGIAEFNFSIPAIPATLAVVLGAGWTAATYTDATRMRASPPVKSEKEAVVA
jgi:O-antigen ligase